jgi:LysM repeat protein
MQKGRHPMKRFALVLILALVVLAAASAITSADEARQSCAVRGDWGLYSVVFGDTLSGIARRFGTTYTQLMAGNCLTNTVIHVGQQLRVPNSGTGRTLRVPATFQSYEGGFMIWRGDTGAILAAANTGKYFSFGSTTYGYLPDNPIATPTPKDRIRPVMGFGKVWAFFPDVSKALGWALLPEQGFTTLIYTPPNGEYQEVIVPDGRTAHFTSTGWDSSAADSRYRRPCRSRPGLNYNRSASTARSSSSRRAS